ncbi:hypothetical protein [Pectobacterium polaris]|uniref:hypothetical protein n=1 Tax=Pectobacterium polaris TaxID=2042057 RepID=UPI00158227C1|nr:hypothetical protein [Pectobacterium polaris]
MVFLLIVFYIITLRRAVAPRWEPLDDRQKKTWAEEGITTHLCPSLARHWR